MKNSWTLVIFTLIIMMLGTTGCTNTILRADLPQCPDNRRPVKMEKEFQDPMPERNVGIHGCEKGYHFVKDPRPLCVPDNYCPDMRTYEDASSMSCMPKGICPDDAYLCIKNGNLRCAHP